MCIFISTFIPNLIFCNLLNFCSEFIRPICLPTTSQGWGNVNFEGMDMFVAGWGRTSNDKFSSNDKLHICIFLKKRNHARSQAFVT